MPRSGGAGIAKLIGSIPKRRFIRHDDTEESFTAIRTSGIVRIEHIIRRTASEISLAGGLFIRFERTRAMPFTMGKALKGWGVVRKSPWHFAGLYSTKQEADAKAQEMGAGYVVLFGE